MTFAALDFETANQDPASVCAIGVVRVVGGRISKRRAEFVRPPTRDFRFTSVHGITAHDVEEAAAFPEVWRSLAPLFSGACFVAAHNASFERRVIAACAQRFGTPTLSAPLECTMKLARATWGLRPTKLSDVARFLGIELQHHDALSDAEAAARIVLAAGRPSQRRLRLGRTR